MQAPLIICFLFCSVCPKSIWGQANFDSLHSQINLLIKAGDYDDAIKMNNGLMQESESSNNSCNLSMCLFKAGEISALLQDPEMAKTYLHTGLKLAGDNRCDTAYWLCTRYLGGMYYSMEARDSCLYYLTKAYNLIKNSNRYARIASTAGMLAGTMMYHWNNKPAAENWYKISLKNAALSGDYEAEGYAFLRYGGFLSEQRLCEGVALVENSYRIFKENKDVEGEMWALQSLASSYLVCGTQKQVYEAFDKLNRLKDSIFQQQTADHASRYRIMYETEKKELEIRQAAQLLLNERKLRNLIILLAASFILFLLLGAVFWQYRVKLAQKAAEQRRMAEERWQHMKQLVETGENERQRIAKDLHDGVGHLLSAAKLNLSAIEPLDNPQQTILDRSMQIIDDALTETRQVAHNLMPAALMELGLPAAINQLVLNVRQANQLAIQYHPPSQWPEFDEQKSTALYRILQEAVNNIIRHARATKIDMDITFVNGIFEMIIADNGIGFMQHAFTATKGLGLQNLEARANLVNGKLSITSIPQKGATLRLQIPV